MKTQSGLLTKAIVYMVVELLFLMIAVIGKTEHVHQPEGTYWFTYGGLLAAGLCCYLSYRNFSLYNAQRIALRQTDLDDEST